MISRDDILRELELLPAWRLRNPPATVDVQAQAAEAAIIPRPAIPAESAQPAKADELPAEIALPLMELDETPTNKISAAGDPNAEWLFVGEAFGTEEELRKAPFTGQAGMLLDNILAAMQLRRGQNVFMASVLNSQPPENRDSLKQQVDTVKPKLIVALGQFAAQSLLQSDALLADLRGRLHQYQEVPVVVTYHPEDLLQRPEDKAKTWDDLCFAIKTMRA